MSIGYGLALVYYCFCKTFDNCVIRVPKGLVEVDNSFALSLDALNNHAVCDRHNNMQDIGEPFIKSVATLSK